MADPSFEELVQDLEACEEDGRWLGLVLIKPGAGAAADRPDVFSGGTASRVLYAETETDGTAVLVLYGEFRFELERELVQHSYREAVVRPLTEPWLNERDAGIVGMRKALLAILHGLREELGERFPVDADSFSQNAGTFDFEELINHLAAAVDLPALRKQKLLTEPLLDRGLSLLRILDRRRTLLDRLRPFRHLAASADHN